MAPSAFAGCKKSAHLSFSFVRTRSRSFKFIAPRAGHSLLLCSWFFKRSLMQIALVDFISGQEIENAQEEIAHLNKYK